MEIQHEHWIDLTPAGQYRPGIDPPFQPIRGPTLSTRAHLLDTVLDRIANAASRSGRPLPSLVAVSKRQPADALVEVARAWHGRNQSRGWAGHCIAFGENYVQEGIAKREAVGDAGVGTPIEWHLIGHLQTNKAREAAQAFDWVHSVDRLRIVDALARHRPADLAPLQVLVQVNIDDETSKTGCAPGDVPALCEAIAGHPTLRLRGLMAIPAPHADVEATRPAFAAVRELFQRMRNAHSGMDTVSMGMSDDLEVAIEEGSTLVRVGTAVFGARS